MNLTLDIAKNRTIATATDDEMALESAADRAKRSLEGSSMAAPNAWPENGHFRHQGARQKRTANATDSIAPMGYEMGQIDNFLPETETTVPIIRGPGEGKVVGVLRDQSTFKVLSEETGGAYAILEQKIPAGHGPPLHVHRHETEIFYVLEGQFEIIVGEQKVHAAAGAMVVGPRDIPHTFRNVGPQDARLLLTVIPGRFANYFIEVDGLDDSGQAEIKALTGKYDVEILE
jgi:quercetin dioxygenase-like cupin family protein